MSRTTPWLSFKFSDREELLRPRPPARWCSRQLAGPHRTRMTAFVGSMNRNRSLLPANCFLIVPIRATSLKYHGIDNHSDSSRELAVTISTYSPNPMQTGAAGLRAFFNLAEAWELSIEEQTKILGLQDCSKLATWKTHVRTYKALSVPLDITMRVGSVLSIYSSLVTLLSHDRSAGWLRAPNSGSIFDGDSALNLMVGGTLEDLDSVARYLLSQLHS